MIGLNIKYQAHSFSGTEILAENGFAKTVGELNFYLAMPAIRYIVQTRECISTNDILNSDATSYLSGRASS